MDRVAQFEGRDLRRFQYLVRPQAFSDWQGLHDLLSVCFAFMEGRIDPSSSLNLMTPELLRRNADEQTLIVVLSDGELVGCGYLEETDDTIYVSKLAVKPAFRKQGILRSMVQIAENLARERKKAGLELETRIELVENHKTFAALGFVKTGESCHEGYDRPTSITMTKSL